MPSLFACLSQSSRTTAVKKSATLGKKKAHKASSATIILVMQDGKEGFREAGGNMLAPPQIDVSADFGVVDGTETSLCLFYAKRTPLAEDSRRVIIGVGRVTGVGHSTEYAYASAGPLKGVLWERCVRHSLRPGKKLDGFFKIEEGFMCRPGKFGVIIGIRPANAIETERWNLLLRITHHSK